MTENPHRDGEIRTHDPRHPKAPEGDRARPPVPMNGGISHDGPVISDRSQSSVGTGCGHFRGHLDEWDFSPLPDDFVPPKVVVKNWKRITWSALPQPPTPRESHGSRDRRAVESMRVAARFRRSV